eukprot:CAMPEP_0198246372 /NCGR_PEP_ID=MMETSP1446-20131203/45941_1 /TAXON_ID=1461542 ORGANISM="Unidentified sp, Strain CCMP2111" /NCGR_SAMPLE_ID=MMETSP1446 /ASSEMBLY_ACC=CAM_ASM_001112 /LENGTH=423 /DNA_ID=CAMNT_0043930693 /DNA_START=14 /DNA_END=1285 /DNA_ORIENTATION=-
MEGTFYGVIVKPGRKVAYSPDTKKGAKLHLSQATLGESSRRGERVTLKCRREDEGPEGIFLCNLVSGSTESCSLDLVFDEYVEFSISGETEVHVTGYYIDMGDDDSSDDYDSEDAGRCCRTSSCKMLRDGPEEIESYSDYSDYDDSDVMWDDMADGGYSDSSDSSCEYDDSELSDSDDSGDHSDSRDSDEDGRKREPDYIIEEITEDKEKPKEKPKEKKEGERSRKSKAAAEKETQGSATKASKASAGSASEKKSAKKRSAERDSEAKEPPKKKDKAASSSDASDTKANSDRKGDKKGKSTKNNEASSSQSIQRFPSGLTVANTGFGKPGGKVATNGKKVSMKYVGRLSSTGQVFDKADKSPFSFRLGIGEVIQGWDVGIKGMRVGDKRRLTIPPHMAYGNKRVGPIPKNSTLVFDVELVDVR